MRLLVLLRAGKVELATGKRDMYARQQGSDATLGATTIPMAWVSWSIWNSVKMHT